jgi:hypothetical protein
MTHHRNVLQGYLCVLSISELFQNNPVGQSRKNLRGGWARGPEGPPHISTTPFKIALSAS